ncbi:MAG: hypothetical protein DRN55_06310 [Thermoplasmata archaeon]|nr:MAG: hypothetical protein DRN55_06310 [Thermoplasmata archaeon]
MAKRHYPPAKRRYEQRHPTVSFRCRDREEHDYITEMAKRHGLSIAQYVRQALKRGIEESERVYSKGYWEGYQEGFCSGVMQAYKRFGLRYLCAKCKKTIPAPVDSEPFGDAILYLTKTRGWHHKDCNNPIQRFRVADEHATVLITHYGDRFTVEPLNE